jgi:hypothetical protein
MDDLDKALCRANEIFLDDPTSADNESELARILPALVEAGYVSESDWGPGWSLWGFTDAGNARLTDLGQD